MEEFIRQNPWMLDGLNMTEAVKLLKENGFKASTQKVLELFTKSEYETYEIYIEETQESESILIQLETTNDDQKHGLEKFRPKRYWFQVIGNV
jgi:uridine kinase